MKIYIDESGDLNHTPKATKKFVLSFMITENVKKIQKCVKNVRRKYLKKKISDIPELKFYRSPMLIRTKLLQCISSSNILIGFVVLHKNLKIREEISQELLYSDIAALLVADGIMKLKTLKQSIQNDRMIEIIVDKSLKPHFRKEFDKKIIEELERLGLEYKITIDHLPSWSDPCIQAVDFIAGAIFQYYERDNPNYFNIIRNNIILSIELKKYGFYSFK